MKCINSDSPPCDRCKKGGHECIFEESMRGKRRKLNNNLNSGGGVQGRVEQVEKALERVVREFERSGPAKLQELSGGMVSSSGGPSSIHASNPYTSSYQNSSQTRSTSNIAPISLPLRPTLPLPHPHSSSPSSGSPTFVSSSRTSTAAGGFDSPASINPNLPDEDGGVIVEKLGRRDQSLGGTMRDHSLGSGGDRGGSRTGWRNERDATVRSESERGRGRPVQRVRERGTSPRLVSKRFSHG
jgi:hypothetical protein